MEVVLDEPLRQFPVEQDRIRVHIAAGDELFLKRAIEAFANCIVLGSLCPTPPVGKFEVADCLLEMKFEFTAVICLDVKQVSAHDLVKPLEKVRGRRRCVRRIHTGKREPRVPVHGSEDVALRTVEMAHDGVDAEEKP